MWSAIRIPGLLGISALVALAADPFIGNWRLDLAKSRITGQKIRISERPDHSYEFQDDEHTDVLLADGLDHPTHRGETMAIVRQSDRLWTITYKDAGKVTMNTTWEVSADGKTLTYTAVGTRPNGQHFSNRMLAKRTSGESGVTGTWESTDVELSSAVEMHITPWKQDGQTIVFPGRSETIHMLFDGKEYRETGPTVAAGATSSGRRIGADTIETTERIDGKVIETTKATVSADGKTQTLVVTEPGDPTPVVLVYEREAPGK